LSEPQRILHVHAADSAPPEREGLPLGSGELGGDVFKTIARAVGAEVGCVPEIDGMERDPRVAQEGIRFLSEAGVFDAPSGDT
jgi:sugar phosphate isomerase/epimerase